MFCVYHKPLTLPIDQKKLSRNELDYQLELNVDTFLLPSLSLFKYTLKMEGLQLFISFSLQMKTDSNHKLKPPMQTEVERLMVKEGLVSPTQGITCLALNSSPHPTLPFKAFIDHNLQYTSGQPKSGQEPFTHKVLGPHSQH